MLRAFADIGADERRSAASGFLTLFGILASHTILETARDALFLARLPPSQLPWVYLAMAVLAVGLSQVPWAGRRRMGGAYGLPLLLAGGAVVTFGFWALGSWSNPWALRALYVWTGLVGTLAVLQFWLVLGDMYTITQAKRVYRLVGTGSLVGAIAGAGLARTVSVHVSAQNLVLAAALLMAVTALGPALLLRRHGGGGSTALSAPGPDRWTLEQVRSLLTRQPYVTRLAGLVLISTIALTLGDYCFKSAVARNVPAEELGPFFATFYMVLNVLALLAQVLLMGWLLRTFGLHRALWVLPALLFLGAAGVAFGGGLLAALLLKGADGTLRNSVHRTGTELLFLPMPDALRGRTKPIIDVVGQRGGQALASIFILSETSLHRSDTVLALAAAVLCVVWIAWAADLRPHYVELFRAALREGVIHRNAELPELDLGSLEALFAALNSRDDAEVVAALDLLAEENRVRLIPALVLFHPSTAVVLRALELFERSERTDFVPVADRLLAHADPEVRAAALRARSAVAPAEGVLRSALEDPSALVRATGVVGLAAGGWVTDEAQKVLDQLIESRSPEARRALARALQQRPTAVFESILLDLAYAPEPECQICVARAMGELRSERFLPALLPMLASHEVRGAARAALLAYGDAGLRFLDESLADQTLPNEVRRHVPRTISRFPAHLAAPLLLRHLTTESDGLVRYKILRGLGRLAARNPDVSLDREILGAATERTVEAAFRLVHWRSILDRGAGGEPGSATTGHELLVTMLRDKEVHTVERLFRLLGLQFRGEDFESIYRGLRSSAPKVRASSRELLENLVQPPLREAVLALVDDAPAGVRLAAADAFYRPVPLAYETLLVQMLTLPGETLRCLAAYHVGELKLVTLRDRLEELRARETGLFVGRVFERTLRVLARAEPESGVAHASHAS